MGGQAEAGDARAPAGRAVAAARALSVAAAAALLLGAAPARAFCRFDSPVSTIDFGSVRPAVGASATVTLSYTCTGLTVAANIAITPTVRTMTSGGQPLAFELYTDAAHLTVFPGSPATNLPVTGSGTVTVYGYVRPQDATLGPYSASLTATITSYSIAIPVIQTRSATLAANATVTGDCTIQPATLAFGAYNPLDGAGREATATVTIACTPGTAYSVGLSAGGQPSGATRQMAGPNGGLLQYDLFSDSGRQTPWSPTDRVGGTALTTTPIPIVVYGRVPPGQRVQAGDYSDIVQSTVNF